MVSEILQINLEILRILQICFFFFVLIFVLCASGKYPYSDTAALKKTKIKKARESAICPSLEPLRLGKLNNFHTKLHLTEKMEEQNFSIYEIYNVGNALQIIYTFL